ncbi:TadE/TadG family type IV pilus assembly protein [Cellulomonas sp. URHE0023]|uniref:TadE/TadG family type IV pilus assembly protein n=1 Tax=Cellulomonas sp. URHE0023 TaxID=1380354 RepID=UPI00068C7E34|nr:TadE/TadG family type IV pilus assembly protein [Cellulomonas sp. URHE0023]
MPTLRREDGSASIELVILFPALLLVVTALVQYGLWFHARSLALAAAQEGVAVARAYGSSPQAGHDTALAFIRDHGADTLTGAAAVATTPDPQSVKVVVSGRSLSVLPGAPGIEISQSADGPLERFTTTEAP